MIGHRARLALGSAVIIAWLVGIALLVRREYFRPQLERLAEAAARVAPGAVYYGVMRDNQQVGFASSTVDTAEASITVIDYLVADLPIGGKARRTTARTNVTLSRALRMTKFELAFDAEGAPIRAGGHVDGDSVLVVGIGSGTEKVDSQRVALTGPVLLPMLVPLVAALGERPHIGKHYILPILDPATMTPKDVGLDVVAESVFVLNDSAVFDAASARWRGVRPDTVRAWRLVAETASAFSGWIDEQGHIVETVQLGFVLRRLPYEVAFENWRVDSSLAVANDRDILETTAIAANKRMGRQVSELRVRLTNVDLRGFDLNGNRQRLSGDTLVVSQEPESALVAWDRGATGPRRDPAKLREVARTRMGYTRAEPMLQIHDTSIAGLALRIAGQSRDARVVAEQLNRWVHDSISDRITFGVPSAIQVLRSRTGDCNEHTQLFVALARSVGIPARIAAGLAYVDGKFYYHAWAEILLNDWVAVDPTFGQFPADAAHLRFIVGGLARQTELLRLMGNLKIDVLAVNGEK